MPVLPKKALASSEVVVYKKLLCAKPKGIRNRIKWANRRVRYNEKPK